MVLEWGLLNSSYRVIWEHQTVLMPPIRGFRVYPRPPVRCKVTLGVDMLKWVLECSNCKSNFTQSLINEVDMFNYIILR
jgi:hypothetical protein